MGRLDVRVVEAKNLPSAKTFGHLDPYVIVRCENDRFKTAISHDSVTPKWNEEFKLHYDDEKSAQLLVQIWNKNQFADEMIGEDRFPVTNLLGAKASQDQWYPLKHCKTPGAEIHLCLRNKPGDDKTLMEKLDKVEEQTAHTINESLMRTLAGQPGQPPALRVPLYYNQNDGTQYLAIDNLLRQLPTSQCIYQLFGRVVPLSEMIAFTSERPPVPIGSPFPFSTRLCRFGDAVYLADALPGGVPMRRMITPPAWNRHGFTTMPDKIHEWTKEEFDQQIEGPPIV